MATRKSSASKFPPPSNGNTARTAKPLASSPVGSAAAKKVAVGSTPAPSAGKETGTRKKASQVVKPPGKAPARKQLVTDQLPPIILPGMSQPPPVIKRVLNVNVPNFAPPAIQSPHHSLTLRVVTTATGTLGHTTPATTATSATSSRSRRIKRKQ